MEILTPRSLAEALELKAEHPDALPIQGGTDVMVALNFDRSRPATVLNLNEVAELRGWSREDGEVRLGSGLTYTEAMHGELAVLLPALAEASRTVGSPQIRNRGTIGGNLATSSPAGDAVPPLHIEGAEVECVSVRGSRRVPLGDFVTGSQAQCARARRADRGGVGSARRPAADVHEGRAAKRDGDRGLLARAFGRRRASRVVRLGRAAPGAGHCAA